MTTLCHRLRFRLGVPESVLQKHGLGTADVWEVPCFSATNNRLVFLDGEICAAVATQLDHEEAGFAKKLRRHTEREGKVETIVSIEVLPRFRGRGIACDIIRSFARDGRVTVVSPCDTLRRSLDRSAILEEREFDTRVVFPAEPS